MATIKPKINDELIIIAGSIITEFDRKILAHLYQPLIGSGSFALYLTLNYEINGEKTITTTPKTFERLTNLLRCSITDIYQYARHLEGMGLLKVYAKQDKQSYSFTYYLLAPLSPKDFFAHDVLGSMFKTTMGELEYARSKLYFTQYGSVNSDFIEVSETFGKVYTSLDPDTLQPGEQTNIVTRVKGAPKLSFDFDLFYQGLQENNISKKFITKSVEDKIRVYANAYHINVLDMRNIVIASIDGNQVNESIMENKCRNYVAIKIETPIITNKPINQSGNPTLDEKLNLLACSTPLEFLTYRYNGRTPFSSEIALVQRLQQSSGLSDGVINVIVDYALIQNDNRLSRAYLERIAGSLIRENIDDVYDAMVFLNGAIAKTTTRRSATNIKPAEVKVATVEEQSQSIEDDLARIKRLRKQVKVKER